MYFCWENKTFELKLGRQCRMFFLCYSPESHKLLRNTRNNSGLLTIEIDKFHDLF